MAKKNRQPTRKQIQGLIDGFRIKEKEAEATLGRAETALSDAKQPQIEAQAEVVSRKGVLDRAPVYFLEETAEIQHLDHERKIAAAQVSDIRRRIGLLRTALGMTPE